MITRDPANFRELAASLACFILIMSAIGLMFALALPKMRQRVRENLRRVMGRRSRLAEAYDVALNGFEIAGGSIRIHEPDLQKKIFDILRITDEDAERRFGHLLRAFRYGAPPHGGIAWGFDRIAMIFAGEGNIREVMAFPKDQKAKDMMLGAPTAMPDKQLKELGIKIVEA